MNDNEPQIIAAHADHRREDFIFPRVQSISMRSAEWEGRVQPIKRTPVRNLIANLLEKVAA